MANPTDRPGGGGTPKTGAVDDEWPPKHRVTSEHSLHHLTRHHKWHIFGIRRRHEEEKGEEGGEGWCGMGHSLFDCQKRIAKGGTSDVWLVKEKESGENKAVKILERPIRKIAADMTYNEVMVMGDVAPKDAGLLTHMTKICLSATHIGLVMEYANGGNLAELVSKKVPDRKGQLVVEEEEARFIFRQLIEAVKRLHEGHTAHRDVKLDNILVFESDDGEKPVQIKLADFQFAYHWGTRGHFALYKGLLGTPVYMSPELLGMKFDSENHQGGCNTIKDTKSEGKDHMLYDPVLADVWACGVVLVAMLVGGFPWDPPMDSDTDTAIETEQRIFDMQHLIHWSESIHVKPYVGLMSDECKDLIDGILHIDPQKRFSIARILHHPWIKRPFNEEEQLVWESITTRHEEEERQPIHWNLLDKRNAAVKQLLQLASDSDESNSERRLSKGPLLDGDLRGVVDHHSIPHRGIVISLQPQELLPPSQECKDETAEDIEHRA